MKKIIIATLVFIVLLSSTNAMGSLWVSTTLKTNGIEMGTWKQIKNISVVENTIYFDGDNTEGRYSYKIENGVLTNRGDSNEVEYTSGNYADRAEWTINKHYTETYKDEFMNIVVDGKDYGSYDTNHGMYQLYELSNDAFYFSNVNDESKQYYNVFTYFTENKVQEKESNPTIDKLLNKIFVKIDKKGSKTANIVYQGLIKRLDTLIVKATTDKNKELLEYIKYKVELKIK